MRSQAPPRGNRAIWWVLLGIVSIVVVAASMIGIFLIEAPEKYVFTGVCLVAAFVFYQSIEQATDIIARTRYGDT